VSERSLSYGRTVGPSASALRTMRPKVCEGSVQASTAISSGAAPPSPRSPRSRCPRSKGFGGSGACTQCPGAQRRRDLAQPVPRSPLQPAPPPAWPPRNSCRKRARSAGSGVQPEWRWIGRSLPGRPGLDGAPDACPRRVPRPKAIRFTAWLQNIRFRVRPAPAGVEGRPPAAGGPTKEEGRPPNDGCHQRTACHRRKGLSPRREKGLSPKRWACFAVGRPATKGRGLPPNDGLRPKLAYPRLADLQTTARAATS